MLPCRARPLPCGRVKNPFSPDFAVPLTRLEVEVKAVGAGGAGGDPLRPGRRSPPSRSAGIERESERTGEDGHCRPDGADTLLQPGQVLFPYADSGFRQWSARQKGTALSRPSAAAAGSIDGLQILLELWPGQPQRGRTHSRGAVLIDTAKTRLSGRWAEGSAMASGSPASLRTSPLASPPAL